MVEPKNRNATDRVVSEVYRSTRNIILTWIKITIVSLN